MAVQPPTASTEDSSDNESIVALSAEEAKKERKKRFVYKEADDIKLLQEVLGDEGLFVAGAKASVQWRCIHVRLQDEGMDVTQHSLVQRLKTIYSAFLAAEHKSGKASGVDDEVDGKTRLLMEYHDLVREGAMGKEEQTKRKRDVETTNEEGGKAIREAALATTVQRGRKDDKEGKNDDDDQGKEEGKFDVYDYLRECLRLRALDQEERAASKRQHLDFQQRQLEFLHKSLEQQQATTQLLVRLMDKIAK